MAEIVNNSSAGVIMNVEASNDAGHVQFYLPPKSSVDVVLFDPANPVYKGWQDSGLVDFGNALKEAKSGPVVQPLPQPEPETRASVRGPKIDKNVPPPTE